MSQHPSLKSKSKGGQHRSVLKRFERLKYLSEKEKWNEESSVFSLPKIKIVRFKVKKEKAAAEATTEAAAAGTTPGATPAAGAEKAAPKAAVSTAAAKSAAYKDSGKKEGAKPKK